MRNNLTDNSPAEQLQDDRLILHLYSNKQGFQPDEVLPHEQQT